MDITALLRTPLVILAVLLAVTACGPKKPAPPTPEEQKRQAEQAELQRLRNSETERIAKEEAARTAEQDQRREEQRRKEESELPKAFGKPAPPAPPPPEAAPLIAGTPATGTEQPAVPYDQAFPPIPDRVVRVAVVSAPSQANVAERIGVMLSETERENLERSLGMGLRIAYLSQADRDPKRETRIQYREKFMQAAVRMASVIPQTQRVERMSDDEANRAGVDVMIQVGSDLQ
jgi:hypothetical protein